MQSVAEFHITFRLELDKTQDFEYPSFLPEQIDYWLNKAQERFIKSRAFGNNPAKTSFEQSQKRKDDLRTILKSSEVSATGISGIYKVQLPTDYIYLFRHQAKVHKNSIFKIVAGIEVSHDEIDILQEDPFWNAQLDTPLYYIEGNSLIYETMNNFIVDSSILTYIRTYNQFQYGSTYIATSSDTMTELPAHTHHEIIDIAIAMVLENIESGRYQSNLNELNKTE